MPFYDKPFTRALYYPSIDIEDEAWLKNTMLYWDKIQTIAPKEIENPYNTKTAQEFYKEGLLQPFSVEPGILEAEDFLDRVLKYFASPEAAEAIISKELSCNSSTYDKSKILSDMLPNMLPGMRETVRIHQSKLPYIIKDKIQQMRNGNDWISVDSQFAKYYMTLLATYLIDNELNNNETGLLTNELMNDNLANAVRRDACLINRDDEYRNHVYLAQGILVDLTFEGIKFNPSTSVKKIINFRDKHQNELQDFRKEIYRLSSDVPKNQSNEKFIKDITKKYNKKVLPAIKSLTESLNDCKIRWATDSLLRVSCLSVEPLTSFGLSSPKALFACAGISLVGSTILYNLDKKEKLRNSPYSYVLKAKKAVL